jgi:hypothetical protein
MKKLVAFCFAIALMAMAFTIPSGAQSGFLIGPKPENKWIEYFYRANGVAPAPKPSTLVNGGTAVAFNFLPTPDTSGFQTKHPAYNGKLLGDLTGKTVSASGNVSGATGAFTYYGEGSPSNPCGTPANVRLYFETNNNELGESQYWWSNPVSYPLANGPFSLTANLNPATWSDRDGHLGTFDAAHMAAFAAAVSDVQQIGLSFGGGCFFANGVGTTDGSGTFTLTNFAAN